MPDCVISVREVLGGMIMRCYDVRSMQNQTWNFLKSFSLKILFDPGDDKCVY